MLREQLSQLNAAAQVLLDFSFVAFIGSNGLGELIGLDNAIKATGRSLRLCNLRPEIRELLRQARPDLLR